MAEHLTAATRETKTRGDLTSLRSGFKIPAVVYGHGRKNQSISLDYHEFESIFAHAGTGSIIDLAVDGGPKINVIVSDVQRNPVTDRFIHVDLHQIRMDEKIKTDINIHFSGEAPAVKQLGANLIINKDRLSIECLPKDLVSSVEVDLSRLTEIDQSVHVRDLVIPHGVIVLDNPDDSVVSVLAPRQEAVEEKAPETVEAEVVAAKEGEETAEGAVPEPQDAKAKKAT